MDIKFIRLSLNVFVSLALISLFMVVLSSMSARADITRGCKGTFAVEVKNSSGDNTILIDEFEGRGACKNKTQANTCRKRAMDNIFRCANDIWDNRWHLIGDPKDSNHDMVLPPICRGDVTGARKVNFKTNPHGKGTDIKYAMEYYSCCKLKPGAGKLQLKLNVTSAGDKGCGKNRNEYTGVYWERRTIFDGYDVDCKKIIDKGYCATRTGG